MATDKVEPHDFSSEIARELDKLNGIGEMLYSMGEVDPASLRDGFFFDLSFLVSDPVNKIKELLDPTYDHSRQAGKSWTLQMIREKAAGQLFYHLPEKWVNREKALWQEMLDKIKKIESQKEVDLQIIRDLAIFLEASGDSIWNFLKDRETTIDDFLSGEAPGV